VKPNQLEFESLVGKKLATDAAIAKEACKLLSRSEIVCVSLAERGVIAAWNNQAWLVKSPPVRKRGSVGAGDSMIGAIAATFAQETITQGEQRISAELLLEAIKWGVAAGAATATTEGTMLGEANLIKKLYSKIAVPKQIKTFLG
jgi:fructose-1-phosphate kinase PfkB-like protein